MAQLGWDVDVYHCSGRKDGFFEAFLTEAKSLGIRTFETSIGREVSAKDFQSLAALKGFVRENGPYDVVHGHSSKGGFLARALSKTTGTARVYTPNALVTMDPLLSEKKRKVFGFVEKQLGLRAEHMVAVSTDEKAHAEELGVPGSKISVIPNGIRDPEMGSRNVMREKLGITEETPVVGFVGRLAHQKAPDDFLKAFKKLLETVPNAIAVMIGKGDQEEMTQGWAKEYEVDKSVRFLGAVNAREYFKGFDLLMLSSRYEGHPYTVVEAIFAGIPVVTTAVSGVSDMIRDGQNGFIVPVGATDQMGEKMSLVLQDQTFPLRATKTNEEIIPAFTAMAMAKSTKELYERLIQV